MVRPASIAYLLHILVVTIAIAKVSGAKNDQRNNDQHVRRELAVLGVAGFIGIDCGLPKGSYADKSTGYRYSSDEQYVSTGENFEISKDFKSETLWLQLTNIRSFPQGNNNCYTLKPLSQAPGGAKYLIRAIFMYGNYDSKNQPPEFEVYVDVNKWDDVKFKNASEIVIKEIIHKPATDYIHICLVNIEHGTPFISALELIPMNETIYKPKSGSLLLYRRLDIGAKESDTRFVRYNDDFYGRIWEPLLSPQMQQILSPYTSGSLADNDFKPSATVMSTASKPVGGNNNLSLVNEADPNQQFFLFMHFAEVEALKSNDLRKCNVYLNDKDWYLNVIPNDRPYTVYSTASVSGDSLEFRIEKTNDSTLPPILNAIEYYTVKQFLQSPSAQTDVDAIIDIKTTYNVEKNWQGDPCIPQEFHWYGVECSNNNDGLRITTLNLSSSGLTKEIIQSFSKLTSLLHLDLSNNSLTGTIPEFLAEIQSLKSLNLSANKFTGSIPESFGKRVQAGALKLSVDGNPDLNVSVSSGKNDKIKPSIIALIVVLPFLVLVFVIAIIWRKREKFMKERSLRRKGQIFTYSEIVSITDFKNIIGSGASATVYLGKVKDGSQLVAVKVLNAPSVQNSFEREVQVLMRIHHKNLASLIGYCSEETKKVIIYEYMQEGNLKERLSDKEKKNLSWKERLLVAIDIAEGLEYLHNGCKEAIIHRDLKTTNVLLDEKLRAKIADFGMSKILTESQTHVTTVVAGTCGYLDPEYSTTSKLNAKSDIYSFGIILLELITGQPAIIEELRRIHIIEWVKSKVTEEGIRNVIDPRLQGQFDPNSIKKVYETALDCSRPLAIQRMELSDALVELKEAFKEENAHQQTKLIENGDEKPDNSVFDIEIGLQPT